MKDTSGTQSRLRQSVIAGLSLAFLASFAAGCRGGTEPTAKETVPAKTSNLPTPQALPAATIAPVGRAELLAAVALAADEIAAGSGLPKANTELVGRTFDVRLPFGCNGAVSPDWGEWSIDPRTRVLRISVRPELTGDNQTIKALGAGLAYDAAEGFWVARPWTRSENCPTPLPPEAGPALPVEGRVPVPAPDASPMRTFAIVQYFSPEAPRTLRRGSRPYAYTGKVPETQTIGTRGFRLKLTGRIRGYGDGQPIHCVVTTLSRPPVCAASVEFARVVLENADTGESLAEWGG
ncbi:hypothetical protein H7F51_09360 [Novosphingobium flavum]|uniref:Uncharacterized protein n=1 Tax=Novosphingobium flavum TaxID=1778672 RepID=A0A7X1FRP1_9SPHN|nr:hypothetical protein [Novosphingobium flavum]MBC2665731.1 hypothetical protein [Novosphingobium flavum]